MSNIKFVMLDFDGTTANTTPSIIHCSEKVCQAEGYTLDRELLARNTGFTTEAAFEFVTGNIAIKLYIIYFLIFIVLNFEVKRLISNT